MLGATSRISAICRALREVRCLHVSQISASQVMVDGLQLNYEVKGNGDKVALCLPGALGSVESDFGPQMAELPSMGLKVVCWDPPGYGKSRPPPRQYSPDYLRRDAMLVADMMKNLGYDKYSVLGWSDGGISGMILAAAFPQHVEKLVIWGASAYIAQEDYEICKGIRDINTWSKKMREPLETMYGREYFKVAWEGWVDTVCSIFEKQGGDLCKGDLPNIICPTLIIHGAKDPIVPLFHPNYLKENIKNSELLIMENGKHNVHLRYPGEFNMLVSDFLHRA